MTESCRIYLSVDGDAFDPEVFQQGLPPELKGEIRSKWRRIGPNPGLGRGRETERIRENYWASEDVLTK